MSEELKAKARRALEEVWSDWKPEVFDQVYDPDYLNHDYNEFGAEDHSLEEFRQWVSAFRARYPGLHVDIEDMLAEADKVAARGTLTFDSGQPSEWHVRRWSAIFRFAGGKLAEVWVVSCRPE